MCCLGFLIRVLHVVIPEVSDAGDSAVWVRLASFPGSRLIKCVGAEESLAWNPLFCGSLVIPDIPGAPLHTVFSRIDDAMFCVVSIKFIVEKMASCCSREYTSSFQEALTYAQEMLGCPELALKEEQKLAIHAIHSGSDVFV